MRFSLTLIATILLIFLPSTLVADSEFATDLAIAQASSAEQVEPAICSAEEASIEPTLFGFEVEASWGTLPYPPCGVLHGTYCPVPGQIGYCELAPWEIGNCVCQQNKTLSCFIFL